MREIKFRSYNKETGFMMNPWALAKSDNSDSFDLVDDSMSGEIHIHDYNTMDCVVLMQYTGLTDKNGKEIYEGDIVKTHDQNNIIRYQHGSFMLIGLHEDRYERNYSRLYHYLIDSTIPNMEGSRFDGITTTLEVIGNIYENPDLLEGVNEDD